MRRFILLLALIPLTLNSESLNDCARLTGDSRLICRAQATLSATYCNGIVNGELRAHCVFTVVQATRRVRSNVKDPRTP